MSKESSIADHELQSVAHLKEAAGKIKSELGKVIVGQEEVVEQALIAIFTRSHALLVGVPGDRKSVV